MRILLGLLVVVCLAVVAAGASAAPPPGSSYVWVQPGTAIVSTPSAQPPASIAIFVAPPAPTALSAYRWAQPGTAAVVITTSCSRITSVSSSR